MEGTGTHLSKLPHELVHVGRGEGFRSARGGRRGEGQVANELNAGLGSLRDAPPFRRCKAQGKAKEHDQRGAVGVSHGKLLHKL